MTFKFSVILSSLLLIVGLACSMNINKSDILKRTKGKKPCETIPALHELANYYNIIEGDTYKADSVSSIAIELSEHENDKPLLIKSYLGFAQNCLTSHYADADKYLQKALSLAQRIKSNDMEFLVSLQSGILKKDMGMDKEAVNDIISVQSKIGNDNNRACLFHMTLGNLNDGSTEVILALDNYNKALEYANMLEDDSLILLANERILKFCIRNGIYKVADKSLERSKEILKDNDSFNAYDSLFLQSLEQELIAATQPNTLLKKGLELIRAAEKGNFRALRKSAYGNLRLSFMKGNDIKSLCGLYCKPENQTDLLVLKDEHPDLYYRIEALMQENNGNIDSAKMYWESSKQLIKDNSNPVYQANFYLRLGQFYLRQSEMNNAIESFRTAYDFALKSNFLPIAIDVSSMLDSTYYQTGDIRNAYLSLKNNKIFIDSNNKLLQQEKLFMIEQNSSSRLEEINMNKLNEKEERGNKFQLYLIGLITLTLIYVLFLLSKRPISVSTLKFFGYITFIFGFEFLIFLFHNVFHSITHSPFLLMLMNVTLIAFLLPVHHATEHHFIHYLIKRNRIEQNSFNLIQSLKNLFGKYRKWLDVKDEA